MRQIDKTSILPEPFLGFDGIPRPRIEKNVVVNESSIESGMWAPLNDRVLVGITFYNAALKDVNKLLKGI